MLIMAWRLGLKKIKVLYRRRWLKIAWLFAYPSAQIFVYTWVFSKIVHVSSEGVPYPVFNFIALVPWMFFAVCLSQGTSCLRANNFYITRLKFPLAALPLSEIFCAVVPFLANLAVLGVLLWRYGIRPGYAFAYLPLIFALQLSLTAGLMLLLSVAGAYFRTTTSVLPTMLNLWILISPVFYSSKAIPDRLKLTYQINPMTPILESYRSIFLHNAPPHAAALGGAAGISVFILTIGIFAFRRLTRNLADFS